MTTSDFLKIQMRVLVAQFGRKSVLEAMAGLTDASLEQIQEEVARLESARRAKLPKEEKSLVELISGLPPMEDRVREAVLHLGRLFESKVFLPNFRDAEEFLRRLGKLSQKFKKRRHFLQQILIALSQLPVSELQSLIAQNANTSGRSDYAILANQLMGKKN